MTRGITGPKEQKLAQDKRLERLESVIKMYLTGKSALEISKAFGVSRGAIYHDIRIARKIWRKRNDKAASTLLDEQIAKIDRIEAAAWDAWEKSQKDAVELTESDDGKTISTSKKTRGQAGGAQFLATALACVDKRCRMLKIGEYATEASTQMVGVMVEVVVDSQEEIAQIMDYGDYKKLTAPSEN